jgi:hypothetical protein
VATAAEVGVSAEATTGAGIGIDTVETEIEDELKKYAKKSLAT